MSKAIMISINPKWVAKILNGEKTIEIRKTRPKCELPIEVYIYCTNGTQLVDGLDAGIDGLIEDINLGKTKRYSLLWNKKEKTNNIIYSSIEFVNRKIVAKFTLNKVEELRCCCVPYKKSNNLGYEYSIDDGVYKVNWIENINLCNKQSEYNNPENYKDDGVVFERKDKYIDTMFNNEDFKKMCLTPQQLLDYIHLGNAGYAWHIDNLVIFDNPRELSEFEIEKAPQSWCYVEASK